MSPSPPLPTVPTTPCAASGCFGTVAGCDDDAATEEVKKLCAERLEWFISGFRAEKRQQQKQQQDESSAEQTGATEDMQILQLSMLGRRLVGLEPWPSTSRSSARASKL